MILNTHIIEAEHSTLNHPVVLLHGLFGSFSNLGVIARALNVNHKIIQIDLRNHGLSPHSDEMNYELMAQDVIDTLDELGIENFSLVGHSMGGKTAMKIAAFHAERVDKLIVLDISPVAYREHHHQDILTAIDKVRQEPHELSRRAAADIMKQDIPQETVIMFLLKSFSQGHWLFNVDAIEGQYNQILGWNENPVWDQPCLFIKGANSNYIQPKYEAEIYKQFPQAQIEVIEGVGHWLHAEQPEQVIALIKDFLKQQGESESF